MVDKGKDCAPEVLKYYEKYESKRELKTHNLHGVDFKIDARYNILEKIGQGAYGIVVAAVDNEGGKKKSIAMKKNEKTFE